MIKLGDKAHAFYEPWFEASLRDEFSSAITGARSRPLRSYREFAEQCVVLVEGPHAGKRFRCHRQPIQGAILDAFELARRGQFKRFAGTFCVQGGKTMVFMVIPLLYHIAEMAETVILAAPNMEMCHDKYRSSILPVFKASPELSWMLPREGRGSRGGLPEMLFFQNGGAVKFMSAGGGDVKRSGFTARIAVITEADKMDEAGNVSKESNPIAQIENRTASYGGDNFMVMECTLSNPNGRLWQEYEAGTQHEFHVQCPLCKHWDVPDRTWLFGYHDAQTVRAAERGAYFACPKCLGRWTNEQRRDMVQNLRMAGSGQRIEPDGTITGELKDTDTFSIRANAFHNLFWSTSYIANHAWRTKVALDTDSPQAEDLQKEEDQFYWTCPHEPKSLGEVKLDAEKIRTRTNEIPIGRVPQEAQHTVLAIDVGKYTGWWLALCGLPEGRLHIPAYGAFSAPVGEDVHNERGVCAGLMEAFEDVVIPGLKLFGSDEDVFFEKVWIDGGFLTGVVAKVLRHYSPKRGKGGWARMAIGRGATTITKMRYNAPKRKDQTIRLIGDRWHGEWDQTYRVMKTLWDADQYKIRVHRALGTQRNHPGSLALYKPTGHDPRKSEHARLSRHFVNEQYMTVETPSGPIRKWVRRGDNHWLDCCAMALAALNECGWQSLPEIGELLEAVSQDAQNSSDDQDSIDGEDLGL